MKQSSPTELHQLLDPALLAELKRLELRTRRAVDADLTGKYKTAFRGTGLVFSDLREYQPGDDIKHIHWRVTARTGRPFIKTYEEDRQLSVILLVDTSASLHFGSERTRQARALEFSAVISILALKSQDRLGLCLFSDQVESYLPPKSGRSQIQRVILSLLEKRNPGKSTDLRPAMRHVLQHQKRGAIIFIISDFYAPAFEEELRVLSLQHDVILVYLKDELDAALPHGGLIQFTDSESGEICLVDTKSRKSRTALASWQKKRLETLTSLCRTLHIDFMPVSANPLQALSQLMQTRTARMR